jgi:hypothetical protein
MATEGTGEQSLQDALAELRGVIARAKGDPGVMPQVRAILDRSPSLVQRYGDLARQAEAAWVSLAAGNNQCLKETIVRSADAQRAELTRPGASPVERLLVERVVACHLQLNYFSATEANALAAGDTCKKLQFHAKRVGQAQRMYLSALGALLTFRKLTPVPAEAEVVVASKSTLGESEREPQVVAVQPQPQPARIVLPIMSEDEPPVPENKDRERLRVAIGG